MRGCNLAQIEIITSQYTFSNLSSKDCFSSNASQCKAFLPTYSIGRTLTYQGLTLRVGNPWDMMAMANMFMIESRSESHVSSSH